MERLDANKFVTPTPVQEGCIPPALEGRDVLATAQTGTGKTLGYLIPIVEMMQKTEGRGAQALICLPTRELAMQVEKAFISIRSNSSQTVALVVGPALGISLLAAGPSVLWLACAALGGLAAAFALNTPSQRPG